MYIGYIQNKFINNLHKVTNIYIVFKLKIKREYVEINYITHLI